MYSGFKHYRQHEDEGSVGQLELKTSFIEEFIRLMCGHKKEESKENKDNQSRTEETPAKQAHTDATTEKPTEKGDTDDTTETRTQETTRATRRKLKNDVKLREAAKGSGSKKTRRKAIQATKTEDREVNEANKEGQATNTLQVRKTKKAIVNPLNKVHFRSPAPSEPTKIYWSVAISIAKVQNGKPSKGKDALTFIVDQPKNGGLDGCE
jgi:hypothetical protein